MPASHRVECEPRDPDPASLSSHSDCPCCNCCGIERCCCVIVGVSSRRVSAVIEASTEQFFRPTRRYQNIFAREWDDDDGPFTFAYTELELAVPVEDFLVYPWDWKDLYVFVTGGVMRKILWITKYAYLVCRR
jgi:hypothetical protein